MKKAIVSGLAFLTLVCAVFLISSGSGHAAADQDIGLPIYPGARQNPSYPPMDTPHMKNVHLLTSDPFDTVVQWYSEKLGKFRMDRQRQGNQALWNKRSEAGDVMTVTISTVNAPAGQTNITLTKGKLMR